VKIILNIFAVVFVFSGCIRHPGESRFNDNPGLITYEKVNISIVHGTAKLQGSTIVSHVQTPEIELQIESRNEQEVELSFLFENMLYNTLPVVSAARGQLGNGDIHKKVTYKLKISPNEKLNIKLSNYPVPAKSYKFGVVGDIQYSVDSGNKISVDASKRELDFFIIVGDLLSLPNTEEYEWGRRLLTQFAMPAFVVMGNHEGDIDWSDGYKLFRQYFGRANYDFEHNGDLFLILDSSEQSISESVYNYAESTVEKNSYRNKFVFLHTPPFDQAGIRNNGFSSSFHAARFVNLMQKNSVDTTFSGHIHSYQDFTVSGVRTIVVGTGGGIPEEFDGVGLRYIVVNVDESGVSIEKVDL